MWGNGSFKPRNSETGMPAVGGTNLTMRFCFATEIRGLEKLTSGSENKPRRMEEKGRELTSRDVSSLVVDELCDQAKGQNVAVACFYFDYTVQKEQSSANVLGALLKQVV